MSWVAVGVAGASAITSGVIAAKQNKAAKGIKVGTEVISEEQKKALAMQKAKAGQGFAGKAQALELGGAARSNALSQAGPGGRNAMLAESMKQGSDEALKISTLDAQTKEANTADYISGLGDMGKDKQGIQQRQIDKAAASKAALLASSQANLSNAMSAASGAASTAGTYQNAKKGIDTSGSIGLKSAQEVALMSPEDQASYKAKNGEKYK